MFIVFLMYLFRLNSNMQSKFFHHPQFLYNDISYYWFFGILGIFFGDNIIHEPIFWMILNRRWLQTIYHYQIASCMCSETRSEWNKCWVMALDILLSHTEWRFINTPVLHRHSCVCTKWSFILYCLLCKWFVLVSKYAKEVCKSSR